MSDTTENPQKPESEKLQDLRRRLALYKNMEEGILTGEAQSYNVGNRQLTRYGVSLADIRKTIKELETEINAEINGGARWRGNFYPVDD
jgi:hypothetical protein